MDITGYDYIHIRISNDNGISINHLNRDSAKIFIEMLPKVNANEYDSKLGDIYCDTNFRTYVNSYPALKKHLLYLIEDIC